MKDKPRTQAQRSATTRAALVAAARSLFAEQGFAAVSTEAVVRGAGVTRGALYHQFADKTELFAAVFEQVEIDSLARIDDAVRESGLEDPVQLMRVGATAWLDACQEPELRRIALIDGPAVLGWARWREIGMRYAMGMVAELLELGMATGQVTRQPVEPLAHVFLGALDEAALYIALADDPVAARSAVGGVIDRLIAGLVG